MILFPWLDCCIDIPVLDFEKFNFLSHKQFLMFSAQHFWSNFEIQFVGSLCVLIGPVEYSEYSTVPQVLKIYQMTFHLHFDEKSLQYDA